MVQNRRFVIQSRPAHYPTVDNFRLESSEIDLEGNSLKDGEILVKTLWIGVDPWLRAPLGIPGDVAKKAELQFNQFKDTMGIIGVGELFGGRGSGVVLKSKNAKVAPGDLVAADWKWQEYAIFNPDEEKTFENLEKDIFTAGNEEGKFSLSHALGALGVSGSHSYFGLLEPLKPKSGETLVVSSGAGSLGVIVGQLGKTLGLKVVGITGGPEKTNKLKTIFDDAVDYKATNGDVAALSKALKQACPNGIDAYFDNTGGFISDAVFENLNPGSRVYVCGAITGYNTGGRINPLHGLRQKEGVTVTTGYDFAMTYLSQIPKARAELAKLAREGKIKFFEVIENGFENIPKAFVAMYSGQNFGKMVVKL